MEKNYIIAFICLCKTVYSVSISQTQIRSCLHEGGGPQIGEVTRLGWLKKNYPPLHAILQPRHPGVQFPKITEWSLST